MRPTSRWFMRQPWFWCTYSIGSSSVITCLSAIAVDAGRRIAAASSTCRSPRAGDDDEAAVHQSRRTSAPAGQARAARRSGCAWAGSRNAAAIPFGPAGRPSQRRRHDLRAPRTRSPPPRGSGKRVDLILGRDLGNRPTITSDVSGLDTRWAGVRRARRSMRRRARDQVEVRKRPGAWTSCRIESMRCGPLTTQRDRGDRVEPLARRAPCTCRGMPALSRAQAGAWDGGASGRVTERIGISRDCGAQVTQGALPAKPPVHEVRIGAHFAAGTIVCIGSVTPPACATGKARRWMYVERSESPRFRVPKTRVAVKLCGFDGFGHPRLHVRRSGESSRHGDSMTILERLNGP